MATLYISYFKKPKDRFGGDTPQTTGEFISTETLVISGTSAVTTNVIPSNAEIVSVWGDANFRVEFGAAPTASVTSRPCAANIHHIIINDDFVAGTDKIAAITI